MRDRAPGLLLVLLFCGACACGKGAGSNGDLPLPTDPPSETTAVPLPWSDEPCSGLPEPGGFFDEDLERWRVQDERSPPEPGQAVATGSSSVRRWESAAVTLRAWGLVQRGFGGAELIEIAQRTDRLVTRYSPGGVLVFAGTNDVANGRPVDLVVQAYRCFVERVFAPAGPVPVFFIGITPTPARWDSWAGAAAVNAEVARLAGLHPQLHYVDVPTPFLATGSPPAMELFDPDTLHLSEAGYAIWNQAVLTALTGVLPERSAASGGGAPSGSYLRVDLGPSNAEDGAPTPSTDGFGNRWNAWHPAEGGAQILAGEALRNLVTTTGTSTGVAVEITGGFRSNGLQNGGLASPEYALLQTMAVPEATGDYFYTDGADNPGGFRFTGLDPARSVTLRIFASRRWADERRVTRFELLGAGAKRSVSVVTSGADVGADGYDGNNREVAVLTGLRPDAWGQLHVDVVIEEGSFGYVNLVEVEVE